jgi:hypothetical protein
VALALGLVGGLLISPHLYLHNTALALPAGCLLWRASAAGVLADPRRRGMRALLVVGPEVAWVAQFTTLGDGALYLAVLFLAGAWAWKGRAAGRPGPARRPAPGPQIR